MTLNLIEVKIRSLNVRFGSKADIGEGATDVRFTPESGHPSARRQCPLCAKSGHLCRTASTSSAERKFFDDALGAVAMLIFLAGAARARLITSNSASPMGIEIFEYELWIKENFPPSGGGKQDPRIVAIN